MPTWCSTTVDIFDGPNWLQTYSDGSDGFYPALAAVVGHLDGPA